MVDAGPRQKADGEAAQQRDAGDMDQAMAMGLGRLKRNLGSRTYNTGAVTRRGLDRMGGPGTQQQPGSGVCIHCADEENLPCADGQVLHFAGSLLTGGETRDSYPIRHPENVSSLQ